MRHFTPENTKWCSKYNFVDKNNRLVGFDMHSHCCESFGWGIGLTKDEIENSPSNEDLKPYVFANEPPTETDPPDGDCGGTISFRLIADGKPDLWLNLYNHHNGYYSHGWESSWAGNGYL